jgi:hypothetical protein
MHWAIIGLQRPQPVPAPVSVPTSSTVSAPRTMAFITSLRVTNLQLHTMSVLFADDLSLSFPIIKNSCAILRFLLFHAEVSHLFLFYSIWNLLVLSFDSNQSVFLIAYNLLFMTV